MAIAVLTLSALLASYYVPLRLYFIGAPTTVVVESCQEQLIIGPDIITTYYTVSVKGYNGRHFSVAGDNACANLRQGETTTLWYSDNLNDGVILPDTQTLFDIIFHYMGGVQAIVLFIPLLALLILTVLRVYLFVRHVKGIVPIHYYEVVRQRGPILPRVVAVTEFVTDCSFLFMALCSVGLLLFGLVKGVLFVESTSAVLTGLVLLISCALILSPIPEKIVDLALGLKDGTFWPHVVRLSRNIFATAAFLTVSWKMVRFIREENFQTYENLWQLVRAIVIAVVS